MASSTMTTRRTGRPTERTVNARFHAGARRRLAILVVIAEAVVVAVLLAPDDDAARPPQRAASTLAGWRFRLDPRDAGRAAGWARHPPAMRRVRLPHVVGAAPVGGRAGQRLFA